MEHNEEIRLLLPQKFRKYSLKERREIIKNTFKVDEQEWQAVTCNEELTELANVMTESSIGCMPVPLGLAAGFVIDGETINIPLSTEEPSVIAAATYAAKIIAASGGFSTIPAESLMRVQIFIDHVSSEEETALLKQKDIMEKSFKELFPSLIDRGGGLRKIEMCRVQNTDVLKVELTVDVCDAMGANILNTTAEKLKIHVLEKTKGTILMCILTNDSSLRRGRATFKIPISTLKRGSPESIEIAQRIVLADKIAHEDPLRAVTHNKGIMNGVSALALATGNDTRALEAAVHSYAARDGAYRGLTSYTIDGDFLKGFIDLPTPLATVGGAVSMHPVSRFSMRLLNYPDARKLSCIAASLGLGQNFAALYALVSEGIQKGHMKLHRRRIAYHAGARGDEVEKVADMLAKEMHSNVETAGVLLKQLRRADS